ncbi:MAG: hypothetical protein JO247_15125 [Chloroflexi bacterium]|nr:hypothetical protein [Chloroflexota bacterium]
MNLLQRGAGAVGDFVDVLKGVPTDEVAAEAERPFRIAVAGPPGAGKSTLIDRLVGGGFGQVLAPFAARRLAEFEAPCSPAALDAAAECDLVLWLHDVTSPRVEASYEALRRRAPAFLDVANKADLLLTVDPHPAAVLISATSGESVRKQLIPAMLDAAPHLALALGRSFAPVRVVVAEREINRVARVNAEVALVSAIPQASLILGPASAVADTLILTKNQAVMVLRLAAMYGLSIDRHRLAELLPVVGAGLGWRTLARELVGFVPAGFGVIPKAAIAYAGTVAAGKAAVWYYETGRQMPQQQLRLLRRAGLSEAREYVKQLASKIRRAS